MKTVMALSALLAAMTAAHATEWRQHERTDKMTDKRVLSAMLLSDNTETLSAPHGEVRAALTFSRFAGEDVDTAGLSIRSGVIECPITCRITLRFDDEDPVMVKAEHAGPSSYGVVFFDDPKGMLEKVRTAKRIRVGVPVFRNGVPVFDFTQASALPW